MIQRDGNKDVTESLLRSQVATDDAGLLAQFSSNPFFTAGVGLAGFGALLAVSQKAVKRGASLLRQRLLVDVEINIKDESYPYFLYWMTAHQRGQVSTMSQASTSQTPGKPGLIASLVGRFTPRTHHLSIDTQKIQRPNGSVQTRFLLIPGPGKHILRYKHAFLMVNRERETKSMDITRGTPWETITLTTLYSNRTIFEDLFLEAHQLAQQSTEGKTIVYIPNTSSWEKFGEPRRKRPLESVILDKGIKERIVSDVQDFLKSGKWYNDRGIPYRRGYLLYGPPGSGKSSFIQAFAGELDYNIAILNLSERGMNDQRLSYLLTVLPQRTLVLLEDVDAAFNGRSQTDSSDYQSNVTFSGLLNALDGITSAEERILFLTTNHVERLDSALVRPGRVDMMMKIGQVTRWQAERLWDRFYGDVDAQGLLRARFIRRLEECGILESENGEKQYIGQSTSAAALQGLFLHNKADPEGAISMVQGLISEDQLEDDTQQLEPAPRQKAHG